MDNNLPEPEMTSIELREEEKVRCEEIKKSINIHDANAIIQFGVGTQGKISDFADKILSEVKAKDSGDVGKILSDLMARVRELDITGLSQKDEGLFSKIPLIGALVDKSKRFMTRYQNVSVQIVKIVEELERARVQLLKDVDMLDQFYDKTLDYFREISIYILAGSDKLKELQEVILPAKKTEVESSDDVVETQKYRDLVHIAGRLDKKLHDLKLSRAVALQSGPQIRLVQNNNHELAEKIQSSILNTIPLWKNQMVIAITLLRQKQALELQQNVSETTRQLLEKNAEMLKVGSLEIAEEAERGIIDIESLKKVNADLIITIGETIRLQQEGKIRRQQAEEELLKLEKALKATLLEAKDTIKRE